MKCPKCNYKYSRMRKFFISNPHRFKCKDCKAKLTLNVRGLIAYYVYLLFSACVVFLYISLIAKQEYSLLIRLCIIFIPLTVLTFIMMHFADTAIEKNNKNKH